MGEAWMDKLPEGLKAALAGLNEIEEVRLRADQPVEARCGGRSVVIDCIASAAEIRALVRRLTGYSVYAREGEIRAGYFTIRGGCRVGLTGGFAVEDKQVLALDKIGFLCIRVLREIKGCADGVVDRLVEEGRPVSALILSPPGLGKTTLLRDCVRQLSMRGFRVAVADERGEIAGLEDGAPTVDLGPRADVADGLRKSLAIPQLLRAMSPEVIATDELGDAEDAEAVREALYCGVAVLATAHARNISEARRRRATGPLLAEGAFRRVIVLGGRPGNILEMI